MGQVLHGSARTTEAVRRAIQLRQESVRALAKRYGISPTTVQKWRKRSCVTDAPMGPKEPCSTVLTTEEEAIVVAFRRHTLLPLDDCLYGLQPTIPHLTRSSLHRCLQRHGISRLPEVEGDKPKTQRFADYAIGYFHIDIAEVRSEEGKLYLFVAIDRTSKFVFVRLETEANRYTACDFLRALIEATPYNLHTVLTDNGMQFCHAPRNRSGPTARYSIHLFDRVCRENGIEHRLTKPNHPWTNGQVERMNRTLKEATVKRYHYETHDQLRAHLQLFVDAYNHARRLKTLRGLTPYEFVLQIWTKDPENSEWIRYTTSRDHTLVCLGRRSVLKIMGRASLVGADARRDFRCRLLNGGGRRASTVALRLPTNKRHFQELRRASEEKHDGGSLRDGIVPKRRARTSLGTTRDSRGRLTALGCAGHRRERQKDLGRRRLEFWVDVPAGEFRKLAFALMREKYAHCKDAVDDFLEFCKSEGIEHQWQSWR